MWIYQRSHTLAADPEHLRPGDAITAVLVDDSYEAEQRGDTPLALTWGYDGTQSQPDFENMVRLEIIAHLDQLNDHPIERDVSDRYRPKGSR